MKYISYTSLPTSSQIQTTRGRIDNKKQYQETLISSLDFRSIDQSMYNWLTKNLNISVTGEHSRKIDVHIELVTRERWSKALKERGFRDKQGRVILPHIGIRRTGEQIDGRRYIPRVDETNLTIVKTPYKDRSSSYINARTVLKNNRMVYDIYEIPYPVFVIVNYELIVQTSYITQMNEIELMLFEQKGKSSNNFWIENGNYKFLSVIEAPTDQSNVDDFSDSERIIRKVFPITTNAYLVPELPNNPPMIKHYRTSTRINFMQEETEDLTIIE